MEPEIKNLYLVSVKEGNTSGRFYVLAYSFEEASSKVHHRLKNLGRYHPETKEIKLIVKGQGNDYIIE